MKAIFRTTKESLMMVGFATAFGVTSSNAVERPAELDMPKEKNVEAVEVKPLEAQKKKIAMLGVGGMKSSAPLAAQLGLKENEGLTLFNISPGSSADKAGLKIHDVITSLNGKKIASQEDLRKAVLAHKPGDEVTVNYISGGKPKEKKIALGERIAMGDQLNQRQVPNLRQLRNQRMQLDRFPGGAEDVMRELKKQLEQMGHNPEQMLRRMPLEMRDLMNDGMNFQGATSIVVKDAEGSVSIKSVNGKKMLIVKDNDGETIFEGPYETKHDKAAVPDDIAERVKKINFDKFGKGMMFQLKPGRLKEKPKAE